MAYRFAVLGVACDYPTLRCAPSREMKPASGAGWVEVVHYFEGRIFQSNPPAIEAGRLSYAVISSHFFTFQSLPMCRGSSGGTKSHDPRRGFAFSIRDLLPSRLATIPPQSRQKESHPIGQEFPNRSPKIRNKLERPFMKPPSRNSSRRF